MTTTVDHEASTSPRGGIKPREHAPELAVNLVRGGRWRLDEQQPETFTMVVLQRPSLPRLPRPAQRVETADSTS